MLGKQYIKSDYKSHMTSSNQVAYHCTVYALSDAKGPDFYQYCQYEHEAKCDRYEDMKLLLLEIEDMIDDAYTLAEQELQADILFDFNIAKYSIEAWKSHQLRTIVQDWGRLQMLQRDLPILTGIYIHCDWAMKFLATEFREPSSHYFAKRGLSWHIIYAIRRVDEHTYEVCRFVHCFDSVLQDSDAVVAIIRDVLLTVKRLHEEIQTVWIRADNAGCYKSARSLVQLGSLKHQTGIAVAKVSFSDPQVTFFKLPNEPNINVIFFNKYINFFIFLIQVFSNKSLRN